ncbi:unnamed protein product [Moneuplotes crassus]|uniref:Uncharacterized protein n=1 Tax=Euplotes crassus TaxID=5936 RepID=A0AAD1UFJ8_EUPCR|nr:unnamed protein product [Moneuplotes crassus]
MDICDHPDTLQLPRIAAIEKSTLAQCKQQEYNCWNDIHKNIYAKNIYSRPLESELGRKLGYNVFHFWIGEQNDEKFARKLRHLHFFDINRLIFHNIKDFNKHIFNFVDFSFPSKANCFLACSQSQIRLNNFRVFSSFIRCNYKITESIVFKGFRFNERQLKRLITSCKHVTSLSLVSCKLSVPKAPNFSKALQNVKIKRLNFNESGKSYLSDWKTNLHEFKNLVQGLSFSPDLKLSLKAIYLRGCQIESNTAEEIFTENHFERVEINC